MKLVLATLSLAAAFLLSQCESAMAQVYLGPTRVGEVVFKRATVGTTASEPVADASVEKGLISWELCADPANTGTVTLGTSADPATDGLTLEAAACFECSGCGRESLQSINVKASAADQVVSVVQYKP